jgi:hypothetical protein
MKKLFVSLFLLLSLYVSAQIHQKNPTWFDFTGSVKLSGTASLPQDTFAIPTNLQSIRWSAMKGDSSYYWSPYQLKWVLQNSGGGTPIAYLDSVYGSHTGVQGHTISFFYKNSSLKWQPAFWSDTVRFMGNSWAIEHYYAGTAYPTQITTYYVVVKQLVGADGDDGIDLVKRAYTTIRGISDSTNTVVSLAFIDMLGTTIGGNPIGASYYGQDSIGKIMKKAAGSYRAFMANYYLDDWHPFHSLTPTSGTFTPVIDSLFPKSAQVGDSAVVGQGLYTILKPAGKRNMVIGFYNGDNLRYTLGTIKAYARGKLIKTVRTSVDATNNSGGGNTQYLPYGLSYDAIVLNNLPSDTCTISIEGSVDSTYLDYYGYLKNPEETKKPLYILNCAYISETYTAGLWLLKNKNVDSLNLALNSAVKEFDDYRVFIVDVNSNFNIADYNSDVAHPGATGNNKVFGFFANNVLKTSPQNGITPWDTSGTTGMLANYVRNLSGNTYYIPVYKDGRTIGASTIYRDPATGNFGFGNTSPASKIDISGAITVRGLIYGGTNYSSGYSTIWDMSAYSGYPNARMYFSDNANHYFNYTSLAGYGFAPQAVGFDNGIVVSSYNAGYSSFGPKITFGLNSTGVAMFDSLGHLTLRSDGSLTYSSWSAYQLDVYGKSKFRDYIELAHLTSNPTANSGSMWYDSTTHKFKGWRNGVALNFLQEGDATLGSSGSTLLGPHLFVDSIDVNTDSLYTDIPDWDYLAGRYLNGYGQWSQLNTDSITEGSVHQFFTNARARAAVSGTTNRISYNSSTGVFDIDAAYVGQTSITTVGTIASGTWHGSVIDPTYGGTGVNNGSKTITLSGNTIIGSSTHTVQFTTTANTNVTLPSSGTLGTQAGYETFTNKRITPRYTASTAISTLSPDISVANIDYATGLTGTLTINAPVGTPTSGERWSVYIKDNGTSRTLTWNSAFVGSTDLALPTATTAGKGQWDDFIYNHVESKWQLVGETKGY